MATYCTPQDVRLALTPNAATGDKETAAGLGDPQINDAIAEASGVMDVYILSRYTIPDSPAPAPYPVRAWTRNIAAFLAVLTWRKNKDLPEDDPIRLRYNSTMKMLEDVRDGKLILPPSVFPPATDDNSQGVHVENLYEGKLFGPEDFGLGYAGQVRSPQVYWPVESNG